jgi:hypothetical protein
MRGRESAVESVRSLPAEILAGAEFGQAVPSNFDMKR